jgi:hypothetical protein
MIVLAVPLGIVGFVLMVLVLIVSLRVLAAKQKGVGRNTSLMLKFAIGSKRALRAIDLYGLRHRVPQGESPVQRSTARGGAASIVAWATVAAIASALISQYATDNAQAQLPFVAPVTDSYATLTTGKATYNALGASVSSSNGLDNTDGLVSGLRLIVSAMGPNCDSIVWDDSSNSSQLLSGYFQYTTSVNASTGLAVHIFDCPDCAFRSISSLALAFDTTCQTFMLQAYAVGADGVVSAVAHLAEADCIGGFTGPCTMQSVVSVAFTPTLQIMSDATHGTSIRGYSVSPASFVMSNELLPPLLLQNSSHERVVVYVSLGLTSTYVNQQASLWKLRKAV